MYNIYEYNNHMNNVMYMNWVSDGSALRRQLRQKVLVEQDALIVRHGHVWEKEVVFQRECPLGERRWRKREHILRHWRRDRTGGQIDLMRNGSINTKSRRRDESGSRSAGF